CFECFCEFREIVSARRYMRKRRQDCSNWRIKQAVKVPVRARIGVREGIEDVVHCRDRTTVGMTLFSSYVGIGRGSWRIAKKANEALAFWSSNGGEIPTIISFEWLHNG